jgi:hypothetical protein
LSTSRPDVAVPRFGHSAERCACERKGLTLAQASERGRLYRETFGDRPDWIEAFRVNDEDRVRCPACGRGRMRVSEHAIH